MQSVCPIAEKRSDKGHRAYFSGLSAEASVAREMQARGHVLVASRWRGRAGEIDQIYRDGKVHVFVEVKRARSFDAALRSLRAPQMLRIHAAAAEYLEHTPDGQLSEVRFDLALVDQVGQVRLMENAFGHF